jgi:hypothetical protein
VKLPTRAALSIELPTGVVIELSDTTAVSAEWIVSVVSGLSARASP